MIGAYLLFRLALLLPALAAVEVRARGSPGERLSHRQTGYGLRFESPCDPSPESGVG